MKRVFHLSALSITVLLCSSLDIVRNHALTDQQLIDFGKPFITVCKVGKSLGDGTLISPDWILTAAHVADALQGQKGPKKVYFGEEAFPVSEVIIHPDYAPMQAHDIALIRLKSGPEAITPTALYTSKDETGKEIVLVGHGWSKAGNERVWTLKDRQKRGATNRIERTTSRQIIFNFSHPDSPDATRLEGTAGPGDSGGPAFIEKDGTYQIAGVSSAGFDGRQGPGTYGAVEHYTRVSTYVEWIRSFIKGK